MSGTIAEPLSAGTQSAPRGALYTPELLARAVALAAYPFDHLQPVRAEARSRVCGSIAAVSLQVDGDDRHHDGESLDSSQVNRLE